MTALARPTVILNDRPILSSERMLHKNYINYKVKPLPNCVPNEPYAYPEC
jgi:hypothetical protein